MSGARGRVEGVFPNILTVDVEDWFHILDVGDAPARDDWSALEPRVAANTDRILEAFDRAGAKATFFVVGWVAPRHPELVRRIAAAGEDSDRGVVVLEQGPEDHLGAFG